jgi:transcriptional regulator with XRE-family HTH domain
MRRHFDPKAFGRKVMRALEESRLSLRDAAKEIGISHATLHRITKGKPPSIEHYFRLEGWLNTP